MIIRQRIQRCILDLFWNLCEPLLSEQPWPQCPASSIRQVPEDSQVVLDRMIQHAGEDLLVQHGIAVRNSEGAMTLHQRLAPGTGPILALTDGAGSLPFDVLLPTGLLAGDDLTIRALVHDHRFAADMNTLAGVVLLVPLMQDVVTCRALGIAAASVDEINRMNIARLRDLGVIVGSRSSDPPAEITAVVGECDARTSNADDSSSPAGTQREGHLERTDEEIDQIPLPTGLSVDLLIAGWSFSLHERVADDQLRPLIARLIDAQQFLSIDFSRIGVWLPTQHSIDRLEFCWELQDREAVVATIVESLRDDCHELSSVLKREIAPVRPPQTFLEARAALQRGLQDDVGSEDERRQAMADYASRIEREVTFPLQQRGMTHPDPVVGMFLVEFGNIATQCQYLAPFLQHRLMREITDPGRRNDDEFDRGQKIYQQWTDRLIRLGREIRRE